MVLKKLEKLHNFQKDKMLLYKSYQTSEVYMLPRFFVDVYKKILRYKSQRKNIINLKRKI